jgi:hypothetical protein
MLPSVEVQRVTPLTLLRPFVHIKQHVYFQWMDCHDWLHWKVDTFQFRLKHDKNNGILTREHACISGSNLPNYRKVSNKNCTQIWSHVSLRMKVFFSLGVFKATDKSGGNTPEPLRLCLHILIWELTILMIGLRGDNKKKFKNDCNWSERKEERRK